MVVHPPARTHMQTRVNLAAKKKKHKKKHKRTQTQLSSLARTHAHTRTRTRAHTIRAHELQELYLDGVRYITNHAVETIADAYASILRVLTLDGADLADAALHSVSRCSRLERLALSFCDNFTDAGVAALAALGNMRSLKLRKGMHFSNDAVRSLFSSGAFDLLEELDLTECAVRKRVFLCAFLWVCFRI